ncbi:ribosomal-protein-alanine acetyltransferase [Lachnospiraceae bacterium KM106-2]|nr:ribosomal-protein-alanine acetyltransferase [Lachnospiraceae bacterium KM106-2]
MITYKENVLTYEVAADLRKNVGWNNPTDRQLALSIHNSLYTIVAYDGDLPVGMGRLLGDGAIYYQIYDIVVREDYQHKKIGSNIVKRLVDYADGKRVDRERISILLSAAAGKEGFYETLGFDRLPHEYTGSGMRRIIKG